DAGEIRGRPHGHGVGGPRHRRREDVRTREESGMKSAAVALKTPRIVTDASNDETLELPPQALHRTGEVILDIRNISLSFGGVKALTDISFDVREHELRAIIGPN